MVYNNINNNPGNKRFFGIREDYTNHYDYYDRPKYVKEKYAKVSLVEPVDENAAFYESDNRRLEQFLYAHRINFEICPKNNDTGKTTWVYKVTPELIRVVNEYNTVNKPYIEDEDDTE